MVQSLSPLDSQFLTNLTRINNQLMEAQDQMSSGLKVKTASDSPDQISQMLQLRASIAANSQVRTNLNNVKTEVDSAESALRTATSVLDNVNMLGTEGATSLQTPEGRQGLADQISSLLQSLVGLAQTKVNNRYVFSGDSDTTPPYTIDLSQQPPVSAYAGSASTRQIALPSGLKIPVAMTAQDIFDNANPDNNVFGAVTALRDALAANDDTAINAALAQVGTAGKYLNQQLSFYGNAQNQVANGLNDTDTQELQMKTQLSGIEDADLTSAILELQSATTQQNAALAAHAQIPRTTLFDYMK